MTPDPTTIQLILQAGFAGVLLVALYGGYKLSNRVLGVFTTLLTNHLHELTEEMRLLRTAFERFLAGSDVEEKPPRKRR